MCILTVVSCGTVRIKDKLIGQTSIERKFDEKGALVFYKKTNTKSTRFISHPHNARVTHIKTKIFEDHKLVVWCYQKTIVSVADLDGRILKTKRIVWDGNRRKTVTHVSAQ